MSKLSLKFLLGVFALMCSASVGLSAEARSCSFQLNGKIVFDEVCDTDITESEENRIIIASQKYFVYALLYDDTWEVFWNEEPYASHAHTRLGDAKLVSDLCLEGENFLACISEAVVGCNDDPNECTPKNLCEVATQVINDNKVWSKDASAAEHITFVKELGMECGVVEITDPCDLDPSECKVKQLCEKATTGDDSSKSWNAEAEAYVELAKEFGLECGVTAKIYTGCAVDVSKCTANFICKRLKEDKKYLDEAKQRGLTCVVQEERANKRSDRFATWSDETICKYATSKNASYSEGVYREEAKKRGLNCGIGEEKLRKAESKVLSTLRRDTLCQRATYKGGWITSGDGLAFTNEAKRRGLPCGVEETSGASKSSKESLASYFKNQSLTKRKQIQYALRSRSYYTNSGSTARAIDGLWGAGTQKAVNEFLFFHKYLEDKPVRYTYEAILNLVDDLPTTFSTPKKSYSSSSSSGNNSSTGKKGWVPISGNPKLSFDDASEICEAKAIAEGNSYINSNRPRDRNSSIDCDSYGFNSFSCSRSRGGGASAGILSYLDNAGNYNAGKKLAQAVAKACMADYGWVKR